MKKVAASLVLLALLPALSQAAILPCHGCSESQLENTARWAGAGVHYVIDYPNDTLRKYKVECAGGVDPLGAPVNPSAGSPDQVRTASGPSRRNLGPAWVGCDGHQIYVLPQMVEAWAEEAFSLLVEFWIDTGGTMQKRVIISSAGVPAGESAFDLTFDGNRMITLERYIADNVENVSTLEFAQRAFISAATGGALVVTYTVQFPDGSQVDLLCSYETERCDYIPGSALDGNGQRIFDGRSPNLPYTFHLHDNWVERWLQNAAAYGIPVHYEGDYRPRRVRCQDTPQGRFECTGY